MKNRLRKTGVNIGPIALGIEHFVKGIRKGELTREENTIEIIETALKLGITHFDLVFNMPYFFDTFGEVIAKKRSKVTFSAHLGTVYSEKTGKVKYTRAIQPIKKTFEDLLERIGTDYVDIAMIQYLRNEEDYAKIIQTDGLKDYVNELKEQGVAKAIGISGHDYELLSKYIDDYPVDVIMTIINFATAEDQSLKKLLLKCKERGIAVIAIKALLKGKVFSTRKENYSAYFCGGKKFSLKLNIPATAKQCLKLALSLGADTVVFGVKTARELEENIKSFHSDEESEISSIQRQFSEIIY